MDDVPNQFHREDWYSADIISELHKIRDLILAKHNNKPDIYNPREHTAARYIIKFVSKQTVVEETEEEKVRYAYAEKTKWLGMFGFAAEAAEASDVANVAGDP